MISSDNRFFSGSNPTSNSAREGRMALESTFEAFLKNKGMNADELAHSLTGINASMIEIVRTLHSVVMSHAKTAETSRETFQKAIDTLLELAAKADSLEERQHILQSVVEICSMMRYENKEERHTYVKVVRILGRTLVVIAGITILVRNPKLGQQILKTIPKLI